MYADDLALIGESAVGLQAMLDIVSSYDTYGSTKCSEVIDIGFWGVSDFNIVPLVPGLSIILRFRKVTLNTILVSSVMVIFPQSFVLLNAPLLYGVLFFALNAVGSYFGFLHPLTSLRLYSSLCLLILLYGCAISKTELTLLERVQRKILRTVQGVLLRCSSRALQSLMGVSAFILTFVRGNWILHIPFPSFLLTLTPVRC